MTPCPDVSEERKNQILEAAAAVFARVGFRTARMDDMAEQAGLSKEVVKANLLLTHFGNFK